MKTLTIIILIITLTGCTTPRYTDVTPIGRELVSDCVTIVKHFRNGNRSWDANGMETEQTRVTCFK